MFSKKKSIFVILGIILLLPVIFMTGCFGGDDDSDNGHHDDGGGGGNQSYSIIVEQTTGGSVYSNKTSAQRGEQVTLSYVADSGYDFVRYYVINISTEREVSVSNNQFSMPQSDVHVTAIFERNNVTRYSITIQQANGGTISASKSQAEEGSTIALSFTENRGYSFGGFVVKDSSNNIIRVDNNSFVMPASNVIVTGSFAPISTQAYLLEIAYLEQGEISFTTNSSSSGREDGDFVYGGARVTLSCRMWTWYQDFYTFDHYVVTGENGDEITVNGNIFIMPNQNVVVSAVFKDLTYSITIDPEIANICTITIEDSNGNAVTEAKYCDDIYLTLVLNEGYKLKKWQVCDSYGYLTTSTDSSTYFQVRKSNITVSAIIEKLSYKVEIVKSDYLSEFYVLDSRGNTLTTGNYPGSACVDDELIIVCNPKKNYSLNGLSIRPYTVTQIYYGSGYRKHYSDPLSYTQDAINTTHYTFTMAASDVEISAETTFIEDNYYTITYDLDTGVVNPVNNPHYLHSGDGYVAITAPTRTGYNFGCWIDQDHIMYYDYIYAREVEKDLVLSAVWDPIQYSISFNANGGNGEMETILYKYYDETFNLTPTTFTKDYYDFAGWATTEDGQAVYTDGASVKNLTTEDYATVELFAVWTPTTYHITYIDNDGTNVVDYNIESQIKIKNCQKTGYTFHYYEVTTCSGNWQEGDKYYEGDEYYERYGNVTLTAYYTINSYTITFYLNNGQSPIVLTQNYGTEVVKPQDPQKSGYVFAGWDKDVPSTMPAGDLDINATWEEDVYQIAYLDQGGEEFSGTHASNYPTQFVYGTETVLDTPTKAGYNFGGYYYDIDCMGFVVTKFKIEAFNSRTITLYAKWTPITYSIKFESSRHNYSDAYYQEMTYGVAANLIPNTYTDDHYDFAGWSRQINEWYNLDVIEFADGEEVINLADSQGEEVVLHAIWQKKTFTITLLDEDDTTIDTIVYTELAYPGKITIPSNAKEGYTLVQWQIIEGEFHWAEVVNSAWVYHAHYPTENNIVPTGAFLSVWGSATLKGTFTINQYTLTVKDGEDIVYTTTQNYGTNIDLSQIPDSLTKDGYNFVAWDAEIPTTMPAQNVTINAIWNELTYNITYKIVGGSDVEGDGIVFADYPTTHRYTEKTDLVLPTKEGYFTQGWFTNSDGSGHFITSLNANTIAEDITLYCFFIKEMVTYRYNGPQDMAQDIIITGLTDEGRQAKKLFLPGQINGLQVKYIDFVLGDNLNIEMLVIPATVTSFSHNDFLGNAYHLWEIINLSSMNITAGSGIASFAVNVSTDINYTSQIQSSNGVRYFQSGDEYIVVGNTGEVTTITLDNNYTKIKDHAFYNFTELESITFGSNITSVGESAFEGCTSLYNVVFNDNLQIIDKSAFKGCTSLHDVNFNSSLQEIKEYAFSHSGISSISLPESITEIQRYTFEYCDSLTTLTISEKIESVGYGVFMYCTNLTDLYFNATNCTFPNAIYDFVFDHCDKLSNVVIGSQVESLPDMFLAYTVNDYKHIYYTGSLQSITIPANIHSISKYAFYYCQKLETVIIENTTQFDSIGHRAFYECRKLNSINIPNSLTSIGERAFYYCRSLTSISIPSGVTSIGNNAFDCCASLHTVYVNNAYVYTSVMTTTESTCLTHSATNVYVLASVYEDTNNSNDYLTNPDYFIQPTGTVTVDGKEYYLFTNI